MNNFTDKDRPGHGAPRGDDLLYTVSTAGVVAHPFHFGDDVDVPGLGEWAKIAMCAQPPDDAFCGQVHSRVWMTASQ